MTPTRPPARTTVLLVESEAIVRAALHHVYDQDLGFHVAVDLDLDTDVAQRIANVVPMSSSSTPSPARPMASNCAR